MKHRRPEAEPVLLAGRYRLVDRLPSAEGEAWRAEDLVLERLVAVTFPTPGHHPADPRDPAVWDAGVERGRAFTVTAPATENGTQIMPALDLSGPPPAQAPPAAAARSGRGRRLPVLVGGLVALAVIAMIWVVSSSSDPAPAASTPQASAPLTGDSAAPPPLRPKKAALTPTASASSPAATPAGPMGLLVAFQQRLNQQAADGRLDPEIAKDLRERIAGIADRLSEGKTKDIHGELIDIQAKLRDAAREGTWTPDPTAAQLLQQLLDTSDHRKSGRGKARKD